MLVDVLHRPVRVKTNEIAKWNGTEWSSVGSGLSVKGTINAFAIYNGKLVAGGFFDSAGGAPAANIANWDGNNWNTMCKGVNNAVYALAVYNNALYAGGLFNTAGNVNANYIATYFEPSTITGINEATVESNTKVYPNPGKGVFNFQAYGQWLIANSRIEVYNVSGEKVCQHSFSAPGNSLDLSGQPAGTYFYRITSEQGEVIGSGKLIIQ